MMDRRTMAAKAQDVMCDVFDVDGLAITDATTANGLEEWDSLSHIRFMITLERVFGFKFLNEWIAELKNVGDLVTVIAAKLA